MNTKLSKKIKWEKGFDFMNDTARYSFEGRDPSISIAGIKVVITTERKRKYSFDSTSVKNFYTGWVRHDPTETADETKEYESLADCKKDTEELFKEYCEKFPNDTSAC
jgi:hypothetical protein